MARRIEHHSSSEWPAARAYEALADIDYLRERLRELGGGNTEIVKHDSTATGVRFAVRQGVRSDSLPTIVQHVAGGDLVIDRTESWRCADENHYTGEIAAQVAGVPCAITGSMWLRDLPADDDPASPVSELLVEASVRVSLPLVGGKIEDLAVDQLQKILAAEAQFTSDWLSQHT